MSAVGHERTSVLFQLMSALPPKADIIRHPAEVRFAPEPDISWMASD
jgi:hypothetical protein